MVVEPTKSRYVQVTDPVELRILQAAPADAIEFPLLYRYDRMEGYYADADDMRAWRATQSETEGGK